MIISETYVRFDALGPTQSRRDLGRTLFPIAEQAGREFFNAFAIPRIAEVVIEDGSTKVRTRVRASAIALLTIAGGYGTVRTGIDYARNDGRAAAAWMLDQIRPVLPISEREPVITRRRSPAGTRLHRLFERVRSGELSADEATDSAERLLREYGETQETITRVGAALRDEFHRIMPLQHMPKPRQSPVPRPQVATSVRPGRRLSLFRDPQTGELVFSEQ